jgi:phosphatidate cytidylyltransferase
MRQRLISAAVLVPVVVIVFVLGDPWLTLGLALLAGLAGYEASRLVAAAGLHASPWFAVPAAVAAVIGVRLHGGDMFFPDSLPDTEVVLGFIALVVIVGAVAGMRDRDPRSGFLSWAGNVLAALYPSLLAFVAVILAVGPATPDRALLHDTIDSGRIWLLILVLTVWSLDSAAYVSGRFVPRGHFMNHISPKKTWSGVVGGTAAALLVCTYLSWATGQEPLLGLILGAVIAVSAQAGDLAGSMLKRAAGTKDSGNMIPGHGGILDRVDSFLFAAPAMVIALNWLHGLIRT